jgi:signal transduction histidine kinase
MRFMEIKHSLSFNPEEVSLLNMHSVLNVLNVVQYDLLRLSDFLGNPTEIENLSSAIISAGEDLNSPAKAMKRVETISLFCENTLVTCEKVLAEKGQSENPFCTEILMNLNSIFNILNIRAQEIVDRKENPMAWVEHDIEQLKNNFINVFQAIEENSHGAYRIVYNLAEHFEKEYLISLEMTSSNNTSIVMPPIFQDVMRDLLANARKYTPPGGTITAGFHQGESDIRFVVEDSGAGIPEEEISKVVEFGYRASNSKSRPTRGGGFGLSKAYYVTKSFGGKMFIDSPVPNRTNGTKISISIPLP